MELHEWWEEDGHPIQNFPLISPYLFGQWVVLNGLTGRAFVFADAPIDGDAIRMPSEGHLYYEYDYAAAHGRREVERGIYQVTQGRELTLWPRWRRNGEPVAGQSRILSISADRGNRVIALQSGATDATTFKFCRNLPVMDALGAVVFGE